MKRVPWKLIALIAGPLLAGIVLVVFPETASPLPGRTAAVAVWMAVWWLTEVIPLAITSLLPLVLLPALGVMSSKAVAGSYTNDVIFLFIGGFIVALAMERWQLHKRVALVILRTIGGGPSRTLLGFMVATAGLSMWISNTATTMMMVPIAGAVLSRFDNLLDEKSARRLAIGLMLGIAYSASIGGMATLVGTPPNLVFTSLFTQAFPQGPEVSFAQWMIFATPLSLSFLLIAWGLLAAMYTRGIRIPGGTETGSTSKRVSLRADYAAELKALGPMNSDERKVLTVFITLAALWITRKPLGFGIVTIPGWSQLLPEPSYAGDGLPAIALSILLFMLPSSVRGERIMNWDTAKRLPWGIVLLFGGGFALAAAINVSGLALWIGGQLAGLGKLSPAVMVGAISTLMTFTTELTSNTATTQLVLPVLAAVAVAIGRNPLLLMIPATLSASCAFMMPVATPPNAIVFGSGRIRIIDMAKTGLLLNLIGVLLITAWLMLAGAGMFDGMNELPDWADTKMIQGL
ncbi:MAG TPA: SLC13/DASS family transporter [Bacteroidetes bacterium]|nr:sodium-dependent dicarboxylate transporter SdcS [bacterium BMS3Bbin04]HDO65278.1 SLC13/DASS family transporter [Bacteroidota bacterium]HEX04403.1 SLC13/DASS family transporter [Bacteroidota bacterium]